MKACIFTLFFATFLVFQAKAGEGYSSANNTTSLWSDNSTWTKSQSWLGNNPGTNVGGATSYIQLYGKVTQTGNLTLGGSSVLYVNDTLLIEGDLTVSGGSSLVVQGSGVLIVTGDLIGNGGSLTSNNGKVVVMQDINLSGGADLNNTEDFYVYGDPYRSGGAKFNGSNNPSSSNFGDEGELATNDPSLYNLVSGGTLPVSFLYVKATEVDNNIVIEWATAAEKNNDFFTVERSVDGLKYEQLGQLQGSGTKLGTTQYQFNDTKALRSTAYYRIRQTDFDGNYDYSKIVRVSVSAINMAVDFQLFPNPSQGQVNLDLQSMNNENVNVTVYNDHGTPVLAKQLAAGFNNDTLNLEALNKGVYIIEVRTQINLLRKRLILN